MTCEKEGKKLSCPINYWTLGHAAQNFECKWRRKWGKTLTPKTPNCMFWQHSDLGQLTMNRIFLFSFEISYNIGQGVALRCNNFCNF